jgi:hypothetical protein
MDASLHFIVFSMTECDLIPVAREESGFFIPPLNIQFDKPLFRIGL